MLEIRNSTPFPSAIFPWLDADGVEHAAVVVKATYRIVAGSGPVVAERQAPVLCANEHLGDPAESSILRASDAGPPKPGTDVALVGNAYPPSGRALEMDVALSVGALRKVVHVVGERRWFRSVGSWQISTPVPFEQMPLVFERAFGGADRSNPDPSKHEIELRNPVGRGFAGAGTKDRLDEILLPNLEDPRDRVTKWNSRPPPAAFGFVAPHWMPRRRLAGTYDERWRKERFPLVPLDFDPAFHNAATPGLVSVPRLRGGEPVSVVGASRAGALAFLLPAPELIVTARIAGREESCAPLLDTVLVEPDEERIVLTWRGSFRCPRQFLRIEAVGVAARRLA